MVFGSSAHRDFCLRWNNPAKVPGNSYIQRTIALPRPAPLSTGRIYGAKSESELVRGSNVRTSILRNMHRSVILLSQTMADQKVTCELMPQKNQSLENGIIPNALTEKISLGYFQEFGERDHSFSVNQIVSAIPWKNGN